MRRTAAFLLVTVAGCAFQPSGATEDAASDDAPDPIDAAVDAPAIDAAPHDITHVAVADETLGTGDLVFSANATIDTGTLALTGATLPAGTELVAVAQDGGGPELAILRVHMLTIDAGVTVRAVGSRPLVVMAETVQLDGILDAGARRDVPGAGGSAPQSGAGRGAAGLDQR